MPTPRHGTAYLRACTSVRLGDPFFDPRAEDPPAIVPQVDGDAFAEPRLNIRTFFAQLEAGAGVRQIDLSAKPILDFNTLAYLVQKAPAVHGQGNEILIYVVQDFFGNSHLGFDKPCSDAHS
jgi:hypothetical protein